MFDLNPGKLSERLQQPLPGEAAQLKMAPPYRQKELQKIQQNLRQSAVMILLYRKQEQWFFPVIERAVYQGVHSGQISLPGGRKDPEDTGFDRTALRETREETGVPEHHIRILGGLTSLVIPPSGFLVWPFVGFTRPAPHFIPDKTEVQRVVEISLSDLLNSDNIARKPFVNSSTGEKKTAPYYAVSGLEIWGATAMILSEFVEVVRSLSK